jgi:valyl-tRNA synthetase
VALTTLDTQYNPKEIEPRWLQFWEDENLAHAVPVDDVETYSIVIPPPNVTAKLHLGHALNNTIQDILIRFKRMQGLLSEWMPGTDHAGIATQNVVERKIATEKGKTRQEFGREAFLEEVWKFKEETGGTIIDQLKRMGCSCDWERERFTMDKGLSVAVTEVFVRLYEKGLIYRGNYIINWCPRCQTALSDEEAEHKDHTGNLWHISYPGTNGSPAVTVATTRPETMLGDVAVAVNPDDKRYRDLVGTMVTLPLTGREIPIIADSFVEPEFGTGAVKVTPAHDPNDFDIGARHKLDPIVVMNGDGTMNAAAGTAFDGLTREDARRKVVADLEELGLLVKIEEHQHSVGHCYRCDTVTEPYLSTQWFVKMQPLAEPAIAAVNDGRITFHPQRWTKVYLNWMDNIRDWCISRQLWWGHRIPVYYCDTCGEVIVSRTTVEQCNACGSASLTQDPDVLDTWFSSWLWPFSTFGWPEDTPELRAFYPTNTLSTAPEIIFFWVARMVMAGFEFMGDIPFSEVYIHGTVRDDKGRKMSKSLGNGVDPLEVIETHGADALRFSMMVTTAQGQDVFIAYPRDGKGSDKAYNTFDIGRNFANKIWNATRFILSNTGDVIGSGEGVESTLADRWIVSRFNRVAGEITTSLDNFRFNDAARTTYDFIWHDFCDWYLELIKPRIEAGGAGREFVLRNASRVLAGAMQLLHPVMPYLTEEIWQRLTDLIGERDAKSIMISRWPEPDATLMDDELERSMTVLQGVIGTIRTVRNEMNVPPGRKATVVIVPADTDTEALLEDNRGYIADLAAVGDLTIDCKASRPETSAAGISDQHEVFVVLAGLIDLDRERTRLTKEIERRRKFILSIEGKLHNEGFLSNAPADVVQLERVKLETAREELTKLEETMSALGV